MTLPPRASRASGLAWVDANRDWIARQRARLRPAPALEGGGSIFFEGRTLTIRYDPSVSPRPRRSEHAVEIGGAPEHVSQRLMAWLRAEARMRLPQALMDQAARMGARPARISLREARSRWGSCSRSGGIMLNWRLVMAPTAVRDYVAIHELAHLRHFNHGADFWALVEHYCPARADADAWLRTHGPSLHAIGAQPPDPNPRIFTPEMT